MLQHEITTRELLRNFKAVKEMLLTGKVETVVIPVGKYQKLTVSVQKPKGNGADIVAAFRSLPKSIRIKRHPELFEDLLRFR